MKRQVCYRRHVLYKEGDTDNCIYFIKQGEVELSKNVVCNKKQKDHDLMGSRKF